MRDLSCHIQGERRPLQRIRRLCAEFFGAGLNRRINKLIELADIPPLTLLMGMLNSIIETCWAKVTAEAGRRIDNTRAKRRGLRSLERLISLIEEGDGDAAEAHWRQHTEFANRAMGKWMAAATVTR
jgi:DNA-binding GntR family transcriptional regulator